VRALLQKPTGPLNKADVAGLTDLTTESIASLKGVECLTDLVSLDVGSLPPGKVTDLSPLGSLAKLEVLNLSRNPIASLTPLRALPRLQSLYLFKVPVPVDLTGLAGAPALAFLDLDGDTVINLGALGTVSTLRELLLRSAIVEDPQGIGAVTSLQRLDATDTFEDAAPIATLTELQTLRIAHPGLANFSALGTLTKLKFLDVSGSGVSDISAVSKMTSLTGINAYGNQISDLAPLSGLPDLFLVDLIANEITDLAPLANAVGIDAGDNLYLQRNPLDCAAQAPELEAMSDNGVLVSSDCP